MNSKHSIARRLAAALVAAVAAKVALRLLEGAWTKGVGKELPHSSAESRISEKVIWVALAAALVAAIRELAQQILIPSSVEDRSPEPFTGSEPPKAAGIGH